MDLIRICTASLVSISPYSSSRFHDAPLAFEKEPKDEYEKRTWREKVTTDEEGIVCIPGMAFKQALDAAGSRLGMKVKSKGMATFTKHFRGGVLVQDLVPLGISKADVEGVTIFANADGKRGSGKRVMRTFPVVPKWKADVQFHILDAAITEDAFEKHLHEAGFFVGVGRFRPENGGTNGRFKVAALAWEEKNIEQLMAA